MNSTALPTAGTEPEAHSVSYRFPESVDVPMSSPTEAVGGSSTMTNMTSQSIDGSSFSVLASLSAATTDGAETPIASLGPEFTGFEPTPSNGSVAGATAGAISAVIAIILLVYFIMLRRRSQRSEAALSSQPDMRISGRDSFNNTSNNNISFRNTLSAQPVTHTHVEQAGSQARISWSSDLTPAATLVPSIMSDFSDATTVNSTHHPRSAAEAQTSRLPASVLRLNNWLSERRRRSRIMGTAQV